MARSTTLSIRVSPEVKEKLGDLARKTRRTQSFLAGEAIAAYVASQQDLVAGLEEGIADFEAGDFISHDQAMERFRATVNRHRRDDQD